MSIDFEDQLRADMGRVEVRPRSGLAREAHRRYARSRRRAALAVAATGTAAAVAGATAGFALTAGTPGNGTIETTAYVVNRVSTALSATDTIGYSVSRFTGAGVPAGLNNLRGEWGYGHQFRQLTETAAGQPYADVSTRPSGDKWVLTTVSYADRDWSRTTVPNGLQYLPVATGDNLCQGTVLSLFGAAGKTAADWKQNILIGLHCRAFAVAGWQRVDGVEAIRLTGHKALTGVTIWVDPRSYLPVRLTVPEDVVTGSSSKVSAVTMRIDFRWLPPTSANLAKLTAPIPPGFREVAGPVPAPKAPVVPKPPVSG
jgi:hypothetical protein